MSRQSLALAAAAALSVSTPALAGGPSTYALAGLGTTAMYVPSESHVSGPIGDVSPVVAFGVTVSSISVELDLGMTFTSEGYATTGVGPSLVWAFSPSFYAAGRLFVPVDPAMNLVVLPGVGWSHVYGQHVAPYVELDLASAVGQGHPDLAVAPGAGVSYMF